MGPISKGSQLILTSPSLETLVLAKEVDFASKASPCELWNCTLHSRAGTGRCRGGKRQGLRPKNRNDRPKRKARRLADGYEQWRSRPPNSMMETLNGGFSHDWNGGCRGWSVLLRQWAGLSGGIDAQGCQAAARTRTPPPPAWPPAFKRPADAFLPAFIVKGNRLTTPLASCRIEKTSEVEKGSRLTMKCANSVSTAPVTATFAFGRGGSSATQ